MVGSNIGKTAARIAELNAQIKVLADEAEELKDELKEELEAGSYRVICGKEAFMVSLDFCVSNTIDKSKLIQEFGAEWLEKYMKSTPYQKLTIRKAV